MKNITLNNLKGMIGDRHERQLLELSQETTDAFIDNLGADIEVLERYGL